MINLKPTIIAALQGNTQLIALLGGPRIYQQIAPRADEFPRITFLEWDNFGSLYADDREVVSGIYIQIDIWSKGNTSEIAAEVDKTMQSLDFGRTRSIDLFEEDTLIYHKAMRFSTNVETGG